MSEENLINPQNSNFTDIKPNIANDNKLKNIHEINSFSITRKLCIIKIIKR